VLLCLSLLLAALVGHPADSWSQESEPPDEGTVSPIPGAATSFSLADCIESALVGNASLQAERLRRGELDAQMLQALSEGLPSLDVTGNWTRSRDPSFVFNKSLDALFSSEAEAEESTGQETPPTESEIAASIPPESTWRTSLNANWEINPGRVLNAIGAADLGIERQDVMIADAEHQTTEDVMTAYYEVVLAQERLEAVESEIEARSEFLDISKRRYRVEFATALDTLQAAVSLANLQPRRRSAHQEFYNAGARLNVLMGRPSLSPISIDGELELELEPLPTLVSDQQVELRPDIKQLELLEKILRKNRGAQKADHRPRISAGASYGYVARNLDTLTDDGHDFWNVSATLAIPIFDGLFTKGLVEQTEASIHRTERETEELRRQARLEILSVQGDLQAARDNLQAADLNLVRANSALDQMTLRYQANKAAYVDVLNAESERFTARSNLIEARFEVLRLTARYKRTLGVPPIRPLSELTEILAP